MTAPLAAATRAFEETIPLASGWEFASTGPGATPDSARGLRFASARVPGTVASALRDNGAWNWGAALNLDASDHWFRCRFHADPAAPGEQIFLRIGGIATIAQVWLNGEPILTSSSMFAPHRPDITHLLRGQNELLIACRSLENALRDSKGRRPAPRWKTRVVADQNLRWIRATLLGRAPGFAPEPQPVGPWRPISLERRRGIALENVHCRVESATSVHFGADVRILDDRAHPLSARIVLGGDSWPFDPSGTALRIPAARPWFPHTHGEPALYPVRVEFDLADGSLAAFDLPPIGFRSVDFDSGFIVNGERIFTRGVVWTPPDPVSLCAPEAAVRDRLTRLRDAGFNLIRVAGTMTYEDQSFHRLCDQLGLLVWQDMMFANLDYPFEDADFHATVCLEAERELARLAAHPSTALICGNSEIEQQASMLGLDPSTSRAPFFAVELPRMVDRLCPHVPYIPSAPSGGDLPFRPRSGVANYFGVGAYLRPLDDTRRAAVRFASECLAFSNVPEPEIIDKMTRGISPTHPAWKRAVPRDASTGWDFEDVRDHYLKLLYSVDPAALRYSDLPRYWDLSRMASAEAMSEVFGEWRRAASGCAGGIILWAADLEPGAGWGILDSTGFPKAAYWLLQRMLRPRAIWMTAEGLNGVDIHVANDAPDALHAQLDVALYHRDRRTAHASRPIDLAPRETLAAGVEEILGRFCDASWSYRFGPPGHDVIVATLRADVTTQAFRFPVRPPLERRPMFLSGSAQLLDPATIELTLASPSLAWGVRPSAPGWIPGDAYFNIEPGGTRRVLLHPAGPAKLPAAVTVTALNAEGRHLIALRRPE